MFCNVFLIHSSVYVKGGSRVKKQFEVIYKAYYRAAFQYAYYLCNKEDVAEELVQEAFIKYYKSLSDFKGECSELTWIRKIVRNLWIDQQRRKSKIEYVSLCEETVSKEAEFITKIENEEEASSILKVLHNLPEPYKEVFYLRVYGEVSFAEIAKIFQHTESWARVTYRRAKLKIIAELEGETE